jgi:hypothetical protein
MSNYDNIIKVDVMSERDYLPGCDIKEDDGSDPLEVDDFYSLCG